MSGSGLCSSDVPGPRSMMKRKDCFPSTFPVLLIWDLLSVIQDAASNCHPATVCSVARHVVMCSTGCQMTLCPFEPGIFFFFSNLTMHLITDCSFPSHCVRWSIVVSCLVGRELERWQERMFRKEGKAKRTFKQSFCTSRSVFDA